MEQSRPAFPATLLDVARATGVHCSTVSLALNHSSKVAATTGDRIRQAAARLGYRRDPVYFALSARRQLARAAPARPLIVFLTNRATMEDFESSAHMPGFLAGARAQADAMGFTCELLLVGDRRISATQIEEDLARRNAQGVILGAFMPHMRQLHLDWSRFAVVKIDSWFMPPPSARISHDQSHTAGESYRRLAQLGYGRIGLAVGQADEVGSHELYSTGYRLQQFLLSGPRVPPFLLESTDRESTRIGKLGRWARRHRLDAVVSNWTNIRQMLECGGLRVPQDVACACLCLDHPNPLLAGTVYNHHTVGQKAVETISLLIKSRPANHQSKLPSLYVEGQWHDASSAPRRRPHDHL